jgi:hypothetical protein
VTPLTTAATIDGDADLQEAQNGIGGDHAFFIAVEVTSTTSRATKKKPAVTTLHADARYFDLYIKKDVEDVQFHEYIAWSTTHAADRGITYTYEKNYASSTRNKNGATLKTACTFPVLGEELPFPNPSSPTCWCTRTSPASSSTTQKR